MKIVQCNQLTKIFGKHKALDNLSFSISEQKITGLIGRNGAGKTTLLKILAGFHHKSAGDIKVLGEQPFNNLKVAANMIFVDDKMTFPAALRLGDIIESASKFYPNWDDGLAIGLFDYFGLNADQSHQNLSKGMKSTFNLIIGIASRCPLTILDEPTTGMDAAVRKDFYRAMLKDYLAHPRTMILSSHLLNEIEDLIEDVLLIREGQLCLHMPVDELKEYAVGLTGSSQQLEVYLGGRDTFYRETIGTDTTYVVVYNNLTEAELAKLKSEGIKISAVSTNDICVYLTQKNKGGIDDVFNRS
ncbi:ABC transporter ATP-binding protein [Desulfuribacillus alkaliarsenatis]|uniref:ABC transporter n=1 Tax=Desulfuribacillus alkaliarsenatis TaxID=766136 RepID=A0A1E5G127_9FIRM|nr:ABC transporter ATP-binding protein [Desulfuribacillus alkaliarsenatis]OEF96615.1 ABC transporter [Desulfuribacillus alkaliarsenatis]